MINKNAPELWRDMVRLTDASGSECIRSLRTALYIFLQKSTANSARRQLLRMVKSMGPLLPMQRSPLPVVAKGRLAFCFAHRTPANLGNLLPVAREAARRGMLGGIVAAADCRDELSEFVGQAPIVTPRSLAAQIGLGQRYGIRAEALRVFVTLSEIVSNYDIHLASRLRSNMGALVAEITTSLEMSAGLKTLFRAWSPSCVISTTDLWPLEFQFACQASSLDIPSVVIQHGAPDESGWPFEADHWVVWGETFKNQMTQLGAPSDRLLIGGMPASDAVFQSRRVDRNRNSAQRSEPPVCLILSHAHGRRTEPEAFDCFKKVLPEIIRSTPHVTWKVKLHPAEDDMFYREMGDDVMRRLKIYPRTTSLADALGNADVVTTLFSTSGVDAMIYGSPLIILNVSLRVKQLAWWPELGGGVYADNAREFRQRLDDLLTIPQCRARQLESQEIFLERSFANRGHASEAIIDLLTQPAILGRQRRTVLTGGSLL